MTFGSRSKSSHYERVLFLSPVVCRELGSVALASTLGHAHIDEIKIAVN